MTDNALSRIDYGRWNWRACIPGTGRCRSAARADAKVSWLGTRAGIEV